MSLTDEQYEELNDICVSNANAAHDQRYSCHSDEAAWKAYLDNVFDTAAERGYSSKEWGLLVDLYNKRWRELMGDYLVVANVIIITPNGFTYTKQLPKFKVEACSNANALKIATDILSTSEGVKLSISVTPCD